jgi:CHAD domain-containing protein
MAPAITEKDFLTYVLQEIIGRGILYAVAYEAVPRRVTRHSRAKRRVALEIEAKLRVPDENTFQRLLAATDLSGFHLGTMTVAELHDHYYDTAGGAFRAAGYACRIRRQADHYLITIKSLGRASDGIHCREEYEADLPEPGQPRDWPPGLPRDLALRLGGDQPLLSLFDIEQLRHSRSLYEGERLVAQLNLDRLTVRKDRDDIATYLELEAELLPQGSEQDLSTLVSGLQETWGLAVENRSKFERALTLLDMDIKPAQAGSNSEAPPSIAERPTIELGSAESPPPPVELLDAPGIEPDDPMSEAGRKTFRFHYRRMLYNEPGTRLGEDIEALHDMRVATRRMRAAFRVFGDAYRPKSVAPYLKGLRRTGRALGPVRDLDVFREKVWAYLDTLPESQRSSLDGFLAELEAQRQAARERMLAYLDSEKYARFRERFGEFVETEGLGSQPIALVDGEPPPFRVRHVAPMAIYERLAAVRAYDEWVTIADPPLTRLHALRIACKRLRYTIEFFAEVLGPDTKSTIKEVVTMQDHLGAVQDAVVAKEILGAFLKWGTWGHIPDQPPPAPEAPRHDPGVQAYLAALEADLQHLLATFPLAWQRIKGTDLSRMVAESVMVL